MTTPSFKSGLTAAAHPAGRDVRLDAFRGFFLVVMTVDHLPSILQIFVYEFIGYVSAAEGFFFLSGFVAGLTFTRISYQNGDSVLRRRALRRAGTIYLYHMGLFVIMFFALHVLVRNKLVWWWPSWGLFFQQHPILPIVMTITLLYQPTLLTFLPLYCIFLSITPLLIRQIRRNRARFVLAASGLLWVAAQFGLRNYLVSMAPLSLPIELGPFDIFAWQILFVGGLCAGSSRYTRMEKPFALRKSLLVTATVVAFIFFICRHNLLFGGQITGWIQGATDKGSLGPLRLLNFAAICFLIAAGYRHLKAGFLVNLLACPGRHSLQVFSFQILLTTIAFWLEKSIDESDATRVVITLSGVASIYLLAWLLEKSPVPAASNPGGDLASPA